MSYLWHVLVFISLYAILAMTLNLVVGYLGQLSLCHAAFHAIGAYATSLLMLRGGWSFFAALPVACATSGLLSLVIAVPSLRLRGDFFVLATLAFQIIAFSLLYNASPITGGSQGLADIPPPQLLGVTLDTPFRFFWLSLAAALASWALIRLLVRSPFGRVLRALRDDEVAAASLGKNVPALKVAAFSLAAALAAVAGGLFAGYLRYIDPTSFMLSESMFILSMVVIGGASSLAGPPLGALLLVLLPEGLRLLSLPAAVAGGLRQIIYGLLLVTIMRLRPRGMVGEYGFD
jgi:branched-chain amino acid transport system permease protein